jgi:hypothetical protein
MSNDRIAIAADDQKWTKEDCESLKKDYDIIYNNGIIGFWIEKQSQSSPLIHVLIEDDGFLSWNRKPYDPCFSVNRLDDWTSIIESTKTYIANHPKKYK